MSLDDIRGERLKKLQRLEGQGIDPYPAEVHRTHDNLSFAQAFSTLMERGDTVTLAGRIVSLRIQGGIAFFDIVDGTARIQALLKKDDVGDASFALFEETMSAGDFVEVSGTAFTTKRNINSLLSSSWRMLAKALLPIPEAWFGLKDEDERYRKRYLDILLNEASADLIRKRSLFWNTVRQFMLARGFIEVETPVLETKTGGAEARPFITHHNALDIDVYLRISFELWHKKLMAGGLPKVFEIGRVFRNEGMSHEHAQDYTHFEFYEAYQDARAGMPMVVALYRTLAQETFGTLRFTIGDFSVDLSRAWEPLDFNTLMQEQYGFDPRTVTITTVRESLRAHNIGFDEHTLDVGRGVDLLWKLVRKSIGGPAILTGIPVYLEPLAKRSAKDSRTVDRFQILIGGSEVGKAFNELNNPLDQRARFMEQQALRDRGDEEAQMADFEYVEAMEYGMPPMFGFGVSERLFSFLAGVSIREAQAFPLMRPRE